MQTLRKYLVLTIRWVISVSPSFIIKKLKSNANLLAAYSSYLHKSGLLYQLQTMDELERSYAKYIEHQNFTLDNKYSKNIPTNSRCLLVVCVPDFDRKNLFATLKSAEEQLTGFNQIILLCNREDFEITSDFASKNLVCEHLKVITVDSLLQESSSLLDLSCFVIFSGDVLSPFSGCVLSDERIHNASVFYCDTDTITNGKRQFPDFKPDWNPDLQLTNGYIRTGVWFDRLRVLGVTHFSITPFYISTIICSRFLKNEKMNVQHIPQVLVSCNSTTPSFKDAKPQLMSLYSEHNISIIPTELPTLSLRWNLDNEPLVSIVIPTRNSLNLVKACIESILNKTTYRNFEILLIDNGSDDEESIWYFDMLSKHNKVSVFKYDYPFNYSAINNFASTVAQGEVLALVNNDIEVIEPDWLLNMVSHVMRPDIGCVGAKLLFSDGRIQHAGVVMGYGGGAGHAHKYFPREHHGYMNRLVATQNFSAVTAACLLVKKRDFERVGGLNEQDLAVAFNDVNLCLKINALGKRNLFCAEAHLFHHESVSRGYEDTPDKVARFNSELSYLKERWKDVIELDPAYNPNLTLKRENFAVKDFH